MSNPFHPRAVPRLLAIVFGLSVSFGFHLSAWSATPTSASVEQTIRERLAQRIPGIPQIDEVRKGPVPGLFEVRIGTELVYTDATGDHLIRGSIVRTSDRQNLTELRQEEIQRVPFAAMPLTNAIKRVSGNGQRRIVVFADPNCGYCKRFEREIADVPNLTVYTVLVPMLSQDSVDKSQAIWCAKNPLNSWHDWIIRNKAPAKVDSTCPAPLRANLEFARKHGISGTPTIFFEDGGRVGGAMPLADFNERLAAAERLKPSGQARR